MNEVGNFSQQDLANMIGQTAQTVNVLANSVNVISTDVNEIKSVVKTQQEQMDEVKKDIADIRDNSEISTQQRNVIRKAVNRQVYQLLDLPERKHDWNEEQLYTSKKYSQIFHQRCYSEVSKKGHLSSPYGCTTAANYIQAIRDIEAWTPSNGIEGLMKEADIRASANKRAREEGYC